MVKKATIGDVAKLAGVTKGTVSLAYSGKRPISEETRARIAAAANELGWEPSARARALATNRSQAIGIVLARDPHIIASDIFFPAFIAGVEEVLSSQDKALVLQVAASRASEEKAYRRFAHGLADGVILLDLAAEDWRVPFVRALDLPAVILGDYSGAGDLPKVYTDDSTPMRQLVRALVGHGHTRIAHVSGPHQYVHTKARLNGFLSELRENGLPTDYVEEGDFTAASGREVTARLLSRERRPTAITYANDTMALAGLSYAQSVGLDVPGDLSITGFDDDHLSAHLTPGLTSVATSPSARGRATADLLLRTLAGHPKTVFLDCNRVIFRGSVGPAPSAEAPHTTQ